MNEEEIDALIAAENALETYLAIVCGEFEDIRAPEGSTVAERLRFIGNALESMI